MHEPVDPASDPLGWLLDNLHVVLGFLVVVWVGWSYDPRMALALGLGLPLAFVIGYGAGYDRAHDGQRARLLRFRRR